MTGDQLAFPTSSMSLAEVVADHCDGFDAVALRLEDEALEEAHLDDESQPVGEFFPLAGLDGSIDEAEFEGGWL